MLCVCYFGPRPSDLVYRARAEVLELTAQLTRQTEAAVAASTAAAAEAMAEAELRSQLRRERVSGLGWSGSNLGGGLPIGPLEATMFSFYCCVVRWTLCLGRAGGTARVGNEREWTPSAVRQYNAGDCNMGKCSSARGKGLAGCGGSCEGPMSPARRS